MSAGETTRPDPDAPVRAAGERLDVLGVGGRVMSAERPGGAVLVLGPDSATALVEVLDAYEETVKELRAKLLAPPF